jgi:hypothetical protein
MPARRFMWLVRLKALRQALRRRPPSLTTARLWPQWKATLQSQMSLPQRLAQTHKAPVRLTVESLEFESFWKAN